MWKTLVADCMSKSEVCFRYQQASFNLLNSSDPSARFLDLLGSFQLLETAVVAAESLSLRLPNQHDLIGRMLQDACAPIGEFSYTLRADGPQFGFHLSCDVRIATRFALRPSSAMLPTFRGASP